MTRILFLLLLTVGPGLYSVAQSPLPLNEQAYTDSLNHQLQIAGTDSAKARISFLLGDYWRGKDTLKGRAFLNQAAVFAAKYPRLQASYPFYEGQFYFNTDKAKAGAAFLKATQTLQPFADKDALLLRSMAWFNYAIMLRAEKGDAFVTDTWLNKAIPLAEQAGADEKIGLYYTQLATLFMYNGRFDKAEEYNNKAIALLESKYPTSTTLMLAYLSAAGNDIYNKKKAEAKRCLDKAKQLLAPFPESVNYPNYYYNEGLYYTMANEFDSAMASLNKGIPLAKKLHQQQLLQMLVFRKYNILQESKQYEAAKQLLLELLNEGTLSADVNNRRTIYQQMAMVNASLKLMGEAYRWSQQYAVLSDSLQSSNLQKNMHELEAKFNKSENEKQIAVLAAEKEKALLTARNGRLLSWLLGVLALLLLAIAGFAMVLNRKNKKLAAQQQRNHQQQLKEAEQQKQLQVSEALLQGEENERERVARDLHDGLGGMLAGIKINLSTLLPAAQPVNNELSRIMSQIDQSSTELRRIARNMMPESLLQYGLEPALRELCESVNREAVHISFQPFGISNDMPRQTQITIYRMVQEMLSNALRHAHASSIVLQCTQTKHTFYITVEDNGRGFDMALMARAKGIGLRNIKKRVDYLRGKMEIEAAANEGTTINIELDVAG
ncbi:tetratricopeptide repeat-containing sensor histidine kinase [Deminuibacter soli]|uniref:Sensor histidine kinase n=1 Tax=Deminuibacter soli TaxID=2291815 RepID=A0A3E1NI11_9BACT|nr:sensor histidine kinase [Deminuibacter soli]RFM27567.1 sensor histidine kinase [Deminuibacter soli]